MDPACSQRHTLVQGQQLKDGRYLSSASGNYRLGFFSSSGRKRHVGIWHKQANYEYKRTDEMPVWVANRNTPIFDDSGVLTIGNDGRLKILHNGGEEIVQFSVQSISNTSATLLDSGNFVVHELNSDGSIKQVLWQSFDYPTDTLLPGMKLGFNTKTGHNWNLTSWSNKEDPASGSFTLGMDPNNTNQLIIWWQEEIYWVSGLWLNSNFNLPHVLSSDVYYHFSYHSEENEKYFKYFVYEDVISFQRLTLKASGDLLGMDMNEAKDILSCKDGSFLEYGCFGKKNDKCFSGERFISRKGIMLQSGFKFSKRYNLSLSDCKVVCVFDCSCSAYASKDETGCEIWHDTYPESNFIKNNSDDSRYIYIRQSHFESEGIKNNQLKSRASTPYKWIIVATIGGLFTLALLYYFIGIKLRSKAKPRTWIIITTIGGLIILMFRSIYYAIQEKLRVFGKINREKDILLHELERRDGKKSHELQFFSFESIASATSNFATTNKLGEGGFESVYKGQLPDGQEVAIKRLSRNSGQGFLEFKNEAILISKLQHTNLVRLVGCCIHKEERMLIYEYMPNKSLDFFLFDPVKKKILDWKKRFNIIQGIVQGLLYLHNYSRLKIIHRDLKASNILLDIEMNPKISDFGMARIFGPNDSEVNTNRVVGTYGYMSPEYVREGVFSTKSDVFSFGVLLLEIVTGQKNYSSYHFERPLNLTGYAWELWGEGRGLELIDPTLGDLNHTGQVLRCIHAGLLCVQESPIDRPVMLDVIFMIYNEANKLPAPKQPAFYLRRNSPAAEIVECRPENCSSNRVSISEMVAR